MAERNTPLINELLQQLTQHSEFESWRRRGKVPSAEVSQICKGLKTDPRYSGQPSRLYASAEHAADYTLKSWLAIQKRLQQKLDGKLRWLEMLKSDEELAQASGTELSVISDRASIILAELQPSSNEVTHPQPKKSRKGKKHPDTPDKGRIYWLGE
jgi:hypothetical protein